MIVGYGLGVSKSGGSLESCSVGGVRLRGGEHIGPCEYCLGGVRLRGGECVGPCEYGGGWIGFP